MFGMGPNPIKKHWFHEKKWCAMEGPDVRSASHGFQAFIRQSDGHLPTHSLSGCIFEAEENNKMHLSNNNPTPPKKKQQKNSRFGL